MAEEKCLLTTPSLLSKATRSPLSLLRMRHPPPALYPALQPVRSANRLRQAISLHDCLDQIVYSRLFSRTDDDLGDQTSRVNLHLLSRRYLRHVRYERRTSLWLWFKSPNDRSNF